VLGIILSATLNIYISRTQIHSHGAHKTEKYSKCNTVLIRNTNTYFKLLGMGKTRISSKSYCSKAATHYKDLPFSQNDNASESVVAQRSGPLEIKGLSHRSVVSSFVDVPA